MEDNPKNLPPESQDNDPQKFVDEVTRDKIDRHLHDINDTISEEDIKNVRTDISSVTQDKGEENINEDSLTEQKKNRKVEGNSDDMPTSWNILG